MAHSRHLRYLILVITALGVLCSAGCWKRRRAKGHTISGVVRDENNKPLPGALVVVDGIPLRSITNDKGEYMLQTIPPGTHAVVALKPGYITAYRLHLQVGQERHLRGIDLVLRPDPNYQPDSLTIESLSPPDGAILSPGSTVLFSARVRYHMNGGGQGRLHMTIVDEYERALIRSPSTDTIVRPDGVSRFARQAPIPSRVDGKVFLVFALMPYNAQTATATAVARYEVRPFRDDVRIKSVLWPDKLVAAQRQPVTVTTEIGYSLDALSAAVIEVHIFGDIGDGKFSARLGGRALIVRKADAVTGTLMAPVQFDLADVVSAMRVQVQMWDGDHSQNYVQRESEPHEITIPAPIPASTPTPPAAARH